MMINFEDKNKLFDEIAENFYEKNFGTFSKSEFELLMFHFYINELIDKQKSTDNTIDYNLISDYKISKDLGITEQKVRNLKIKHQLVYPIDYDWQKSFARLISNARYDNESKEIIINIPDPNLYLEIKNYFEENGGYVKKQLNHNLLQIRVEYFLQIVLNLESEKDKSNIIKKISKILRDKNKNEGIINCENLGTKLIKNGIDIVTILSEVNNLCTAGSLLGAVCKLVTHL